MDNTSDDIELTGPICKVCGGPADRRAVSCAACAAPHHWDCWFWNGRCSRFGCGSVDWNPLAEATVEHLQFGEATAIEPARPWPAGGARKRFAWEPYLRAEVGAALALGAWLAGLAAAWPGQGGEFAGQALRQAATGMLLPALLFLGAAFARGALAVVEWFRLHLWDEQQVFQCAIGGCFLLATALQLGHGRAGLLWLVGVLAFDAAIVFPTGYRWRTALRCLAPALGFTLALSACASSSGLTGPPAALSAAQSAQPEARELSESLREGRLGIRARVLGPARRSFAGSYRAAFEACVPEALVRLGQRRVLDETLATASGGGDLASRREACVTLGFCPKDAVRPHLEALLGDSAAAVRKAAFESLFLCGGLERDRFDLWFRMASDPDAAVRTSVAWALAWSHTMPLPGGPAATELGFPDRVFLLREYPLAAWGCSPSGGGRSLALLKTLDPGVSRADPLVRLLAGFLEEQAFDALRHDPAPGALWTPLERLAGLPVGGLLPATAELLPGRDSSWLWASAPTVPEFSERLARGLRGPDAARAEQLLRVLPWTPGYEFEKGFEAIVGSGENDIRFGSEARLRFLSSASQLGRNASACMARLEDRLLASSAPPLERIARLLLLSRSQVTGNLAAPLRELLAVDESRIPAACVLASMDDPSGLPALLEAHERARSDAAGGYRQRVSR